MQLSAHFSLTEMTNSATARRLGIQNDPPPELYPRLQQTADMLERIRSALSAAQAKPVPIIITSGYRCKALNRAVGGVTSSDHTRGEAADWVAPSFGGPHRICKFLAPLLGSLQIGQLIYEAVRRRDGGLSEWVHVSTRIPDQISNRVITVTAQGAMLGIQEVT